MLLLHGHRGNRDQLLVHAEYLVEAGYGALSIDFRNHGESDGEFTSMGYHELKDARAAFRFLQDQRGSRRDRDMGSFHGRRCRQPIDARS